ncbi:MAG TPA: S53 family peptidase [Candidatus Baltobacteraceae bacterium]|nr:S53 family peptidase [Candidatus Baltobacteraceae bacterium]
MHRFPRRAAAAAAACTVLAGCSQSGVSSVPPSRAISDSAKQASAPFGYSVHPRVRRLGDLLLHNCSSAGSTDCLTPTTIRSGYDFSYTPGVSDGSGQTIVIVDAFGSPTITKDVATFDKLFGLPDPVITTYYPGGKPTVNLNNATQLSWAEETSLDVEWAHAAAPGAAIALVIANNDQGQTIQATQLYAASNFPNSAMSLSFGVQELSINGGANNTQLVQAQQIYQTAAANHITVIASAGDLGAGGGFGTPNPQYPASDPNVLSVGGTNLSLFHNGRYRNESVWNDSDNCVSPCLLPNDGATGGAPSTIFTNALIPNQAILLGGKTARAVADVAYNASPNTGVVVVIGFSAKGVSPGTYAVGGTSQGPPQYAGIIAIANQLRAHMNPARGPLGPVTNALYGAVLQGAQTTKTPPFHDVSIGDNVFPAGSNGFSAGAGYDYPTGLGSPDINNLMNVLVNLP